MEQEANEKKERKMSCKTKGSSESCGGAVYGLGIIGAAVYFISSATGFWNGALGFLKALVWPAILVFKMFKFLGN
jgi:hypothetical protein